MAIIIRTEIKYNNDEWFEAQSVKGEMLRNGWEQNEPELKKSGLNLNIIYLEKDINKEKKDFVDIRKILRNIIKSAESYFYWQQKYDNNIMRNTRQAMEDLKNKIEEGKKFIENERNDIN